MGKRAHCNKVNLDKKRNQRTIETKLVIVVVMENDGNKKRKIEIKREIQDTDDAQDDWKGRYNEILRVHIENRTKRMEDQRLIQKLQVDVAVAQKTIQDWTKTRTVGEEEEGKTKDDTVKEGGKVKNSTMSSINGGLDPVPSPQGPPGARVSTVIDSASSHPPLGLSTIPWDPAGSFSLADYSGITDTSFEFETGVGDVTIPEPPSVGYHYQTPAIAGYPSQSPIHPSPIPLRVSGETRAPPSPASQVQAVHHMADGSIRHSGLTNSIQFKEASTISATKESNNELIAALTKNHESNAKLQATLLAFAKANVPAKKGELLNTNDTNFKVQRTTVPATAEALVESCAELVVEKNFNENLRRELAKTKSKLSVVTAKSTAEVIVANETIEKLKQELNKTKKQLITTTKQSHSPVILTGAKRSLSPRKLTTPATSDALLEMSTNLVESKKLIRKLEADLAAAMKKGSEAPSKLTLTGKTKSVTAMPSKKVTDESISGSFNLKLAINRANHAEKEAKMCKDKLINEKIANRELEIKLLEAKQHSAHSHVSNNARDAIQSIAQEVITDEDNTTSSDDEEASGYKKDEEWTIMFKQLREYYLVYDTCKVPYLRNDNGSPYFHLGRWVRTQRAQKTQKKLDAARVAKLNT